MSFSGWRRHGVLAAVGIALVASGFPALAFIGDGEGVAELLLLVPVTLVSWCWGEWVGLLAALGGVVYTNVTLLAGNLVVHHRSVSARWLLVVIVSDLLAVYLAVVVGKLSEAIQEKGAAEGAVRSSADHLQAVLRAVLRAVPDHVLEFDRRGTVHDSRFFRHRFLAGSAFGVVHRPGGHGTVVRRGFRNRHERHRRSR